MSVLIETKSSDNYLDVGTLPEGWRPDWYVVCPAYMAGDTDGVYVDITTEGAVHAQPSGKAGKFYGMATFAVR